MVTIEGVIFEGEQIIEVTVHPYDVIVVWPREEDNVYDRHAAQFVGGLTKILPS